MYRLAYGVKYFHSTSLASWNQLTLVYLSALPEEECIQTREYTDSREQ